MKSNQCRDYEHPRIGRWLGDRSLQLLDPGEAALESAGHLSSSRRRRSISTVSTVFELADFGDHRVCALVAQRPLDHRDVVLELDGDAVVRAAAHEVYARAPSKRCSGCSTACPSAGAMSRWSGGQPAPLTCG